MLRVGQLSCVSFHKEVNGHWSLKIRSILYKQSGNKWNFYGNKRDTEGNGWDKLKPCDSRESCQSRFLGVTPKASSNRVRAGSSNLTDFSSHSLNVSDDFFGYTGKLSDWPKEDCVNISYCDISLKFILSF